MRMNLQDYESRLVEVFGHERLEETAFPVYTNRLWAARYLGWARINAVKARMMGRRGGVALDYGSGLGVLLPFLCEYFDHVVACDLDTSITEFMVSELGLRNVEVVESVDQASRKEFDVITALDVLEHIEDLRPVYETFLAVSASDARWYISGPTENLLYRAMRKVARTTGEGHVHTIKEVLAEVPPQLSCLWKTSLPFGLPLFTVAEFEHISS